MFISVACRNGGGDGFCKALSDIEKAIDEQSVTRASPATKTKSDGG